MTALHLVAAIRTVTGRRHADNQDAAGFCSDYAFVADGVGGHAGGDVASRTVSHALMTALAGRPPGAVGPADLRAGLTTANTAIAGRIRSEEQLAGMATTFTGVFCGDDVVRVLHIGDSRAYVVRGSAGHRVTTDDSPVQMLLDSGAIDEAAARHHPLRHVLLRCLGGGPADVQDVAVLEVTARAGDRWLVTSDGLTDAVADDVVLRLLRDAPDPESAADALVAAAQQAGARDDVSIVVGDLAPGPPAERSYRLAGAAAEPDTDRTAGTRG